MNITEFLLARIAEDEAKAIEVKEMRADVFYDDDPHADHLAVYAHNDGALWSPSISMAYRRMLVECESKRRIVDRCVGSLESDCGEYERAFALTVLRELATPYADHPDYDPA